MNRIQEVGLSFVIAGLSVVTALAAQVEEPAAKHGPGPVEQIEESVKRAGKSVEESVKSTVKKIEDEHLAEKVEKKLKQTLDETVEGIEKTGKAIEKKFTQ